jgi:hypothetical protein
MRDLGFSNLTADNLIALKIHGVNRSFMDEMKALGFTGLSADRAIALKIHNVNEAYVNEMRRLGLANLTPVRLIAMKMLDLDRELVEELRETRYDDGLLRDVLRRKNNYSYRNLDDNWAREYRDAMEDILRELTR